MAKIIHKTLTPDDIKKHMQAMDENELLAQDIAIQACVSALSYLLMKGCTEERVTEILQSLKVQSDIVKDEFKSRNSYSPFDEHTYFN